MKLRHPLRSPPLSSALLRSLSLSQGTSTSRRRAASSATAAGSAPAASRPRACTASRRRRRRRRLVARRARNLSARARGRFLSPLLLFLLFSRRAARPLRRGARRRAPRRRARARPQLHDGGGRQRRAAARVAARGRGRAVLGRPDEDALRAALAAGRARGRVRRGRVDRSPRGPRRGGRARRGSQRWRALARARKRAGDRDRVGSPADAARCVRRRSGGRSHPEVRGHLVPSSTGQPFRDGQREEGGREGGSARELSFHPPRARSRAIAAASLPVVVSPPCSDMTSSSPPAFCE